MYSILYRDLLAVKVWLDPLVPEGQLGPVAPLDQQDLQELPAETDNLVLLINAHFSLFDYFSCFVSLLQDQLEIKDHKVQQDLLGQ